MLDLTEKNALDAGKLRAVTKVKNKKFIAIFICEIPDVL